MPIILAVEPDHKQAARLAAIVRHHVGAELVIGDTTERALDALGPRVPDMVLVPALLSPQDDASLAAALRVIAAAAHVRTLTIPVLGSGRQQSSSNGLLSRWRRGRAESPEPDGCDPAVFAEQITAYLKEAAAERAERDDNLESPVVRLAEPPRPAPDAREDTQITHAFEAVEPSAFDSYAEPSAFESYSGNESFAAETFVPAETFAAAETSAVPKPLTAAERYAGAETYTTETYEAETYATPTYATSAYDTTLSAAEQEEPAEQEGPADSESPVLDLSIELGSLTPPANDQHLYDGEPFGTYTLPPFDEVRAEAGASLDTAFNASLPIDTAPVFDAPIAARPVFDSGIDLDEPVMLEDPIVFDEPIVLTEPVVFEPPALFDSIDLETGDDSLAVFDQSIAAESPLAFQALPVQESPKAVEPPAVVQHAPVEASQPLAAAPRVASPIVEKPAAIAKAPAAFEPPEVLELATPVAMTPWRAWPPIEGVPIEVPGIAAVAKADVPDWTELMASLRQDMERRRTQEHRPPATRKPRSKSAKPTVDEWGFFDPEQCGFSALLAKLDEITTTSQ